MLVLLVAFQDEYNVMGSLLSAIILFNDKFDTNSTDREGAKVDVMHLSRLLVTLGFDVTIWRNRTAQVSAPDSRDNPQLIYKP